MMEKSINEKSSFKYAPVSRKLEAELQKWLLTIQPIPIKIVLSSNGQ